MYKKMKEKRLSGNIVTIIFSSHKHQAKIARHGVIIAILSTFRLFAMADSFPASASMDAGYTLSDYSSLKKLMDDLKLDNNLPTYQVNMIKGDVSFSRGNYFEAQKYYRRSINDHEIRDSLHLLLKIEFKQMLCFDRMEAFSLISHSLDEFKSSAQQLADHECLAAVPYFKGKVAYYSGDKEKGFELIRLAIEMMKKTNEGMNYDYLMYFYNNLVKLLQRNHKGRDALATLNEMGELMRMQRQQVTSSLAFSDDTWMKEFYGLNAITLQRMGNTEDANNSYNKFLAMTHVQIYDYSCIESYLFEKKLYDDVIRFGQLRLSYLSSMNDTLNGSIPSVYRLLAKAYACKGLYEEAIRNYVLMDEAHDVQMRMAELSAMDELSANYSAYIEELEKQRKAHHSRIVNVLIIIGFIAAMIGLSIGRTIRYNRIIKQKNVSLVRTINELMTTKAKAEMETGKRRDENDNRQENEEDGVSAEQLLMAELKENSETMADYQERRKFERMNRDIVEKKLYLDTSLSRMMLLDKYNIPRNNFSSLFQKYVGTSYSKYINNLRLEQAAKLLKEQPNYTIESIASDCGISSVATLYRLFSKKYGMTPTEYRQTVILSKELEEDCDEVDD